MVSRGESAIQGAAPGWATDLLVAACIEVVGLGDAAWSARPGLDSSREEAEHGVGGSGVCGDDAAGAAHQVRAVSAAEVWTEISGPWAGDGHASGVRRVGHA